jgi:hypothetical protein
MAFWMLIAGLALALAGALVSALADAWLSRSLLIYLDAVEANLGQVAEAIKTGTTKLRVTGIDLKRDRSQNRARALKTLGWLALALGFALQIAAACLVRLSQA